MFSALLLYSVFMRYQVGKSYQRPCIQTEGQWLPILDLEPHDDLAIGIQEKHIHVDSRFLTNELLETREPHWAEGFIWAIFLEDIEAVELRELLCRRQHILRTPTYRLAGMAGAEKECQGDRVGSDLRCPHKGQILSDAPVIAGCWQCPAHGLHWSQATGGLVPVYSQIKREQDELRSKIDAKMGRLEKLLG